MWLDVRRVFVVAIIALNQFCAFSHSTGFAKNVLLLISDDMRPDIGAYGAQHMVTPSLDRLASRSAVFRRAYVQQAVCSPSRTSMLTGRRPDTTRVVDLIHYWRHQGGNFTTLPEYFKQHGYKTAGIGKVCTAYFRLAIRLWLVGLWWATSLRWWTNDYSIFMQSIYKLQFSIISHCLLLIFWRCNFFSVSLT